MCRHVCHLFDRPEAFNVFFVRIHIRTAPLKKKRKKRREKKRREKHNRPVNFRFSFFSFVNIVHHTVLKILLIYGLLADTPSTPK